jgi:hypothetical protein
VETGSNKLAATIGATSGAGWTAGKTEVVAVPGVWYHVVCSWDGAIGRVYVNGVESKTYSLSASNFVNRAATTRLGSSANSSAYLLSGKVDSARLYSRALSYAEIISIYEAEK